MDPTLKPENYETRTETEGSWKLRVNSYQLGDRFICTVDNVDPGANVARAEAPTREEAEATALEKARRRIQDTRVIE